MNNAMVAAGYAAAEELNGTARHLIDVATEEQRNNEDFCAALDSEVFECEACGWWCETWEDNGEGLCSGCAPDEGDEDDE